MRRRNLMIGLGVLATGSGATALTGATLSNTVSPTADFRVNVDAADLVVKRGQNFSDGSDETISTDTGDITGDITYVDDGASTGLNGKTAFTAAANTDTNGSLDFGILIPFDDIPTSGGPGLATTSTSGDQSYTFPGLLQVDNLDTSDVKHVVMQYAESIDTSTSTGAAGSTNGYVTSASDGAVDGTAEFNAPLVGENVDGGNDLSFDEVAHMFQFSVEDSEDSNTAKRVSPPGDASTAGNGNQLPANSFTIAADSSTSIDLTVNFTEALGDDIAGFVARENLDADGGTVRLLDTIFVAEASGPTDDSTGNITANTF